eukprot:CAMPEP_0206138182 /NCGR_PEP_ID=MMETSP1473-20131121/3140_1 /ASSEMBLY_ACC=CAM_ASM_001109 /TAXON_ID=1461547 /ORGANISM="Stichococcus sp, Strain RCC1054" /LENGTH=69 /DNA_ID=CAMNT_0053531539 /DNA_START=1403 /DNA_END=1613 /DNA_ORIENTATION=+
MRRQPRGFFRGHFHIFDAVDNMLKREGPSVAQEHTVLQSGVQSSAVAPLNALLQPSPSLLVLQRFLAGS